VPAPSIEAAPSRSMANMGPIAKDERSGLSLDRAARSTPDEYFWAARPAVEEWALLASAIHWVEELEAQLSRDAVRTLRIDGQPDRYFR